MASHLFDDSIFVVWTDRRWRHLRQCNSCTTGDYFSLASTQQASNFVWHILLNCTTCVLQLSSVGGRNLSTR